VVRVVLGACLVVLEELDFEELEADIAGALFVVVVVEVVVVLPADFVPDVLVCFIYLFSCRLKKSLCENLFFSLL
jgi:hypothetical protein